jgi:hypothetical protein
MSDTDLSAVGDDVVEPSTVIKVAAPFIALAATWAVRKAMDAAYTRATGAPPPRASDPHASMRRILVYAAVTAAAVAVVNVAVDRLTAPRPHQG